MFTLKQLLLYLKIAVSLMVQRPFGIVISHETTWRGEALENENLTIFNFNINENERIGTTMHPLYLFSHYSTGATQVQKIDSRSISISIIRIMKGSHVIHCHYHINYYHYY